MRSIKDLRLALEPEATARAALRRTETDIAAISAAYEEMASTIGDVNSNADADLRFHTAIFAATHNMIYSQLIDLIAVGIYANRTLSGDEDIAEGQKRALPLHKAILDAIVAQDTEAAIKASRNLLEAWLARDYGF
jgi:DNA-binding FadR family transcriptional regulator